MEWNGMKRCVYVYVHTCLDMSICVHMSIHRYIYTSSHPYNCASQRRYIYTSIRLYNFYTCILCVAYFRRARFEPNSQQTTNNTKKQTPSVKRACKVCRTNDAHAVHKLKRTWCHCCAMDMCNCAHRLPLSDSTPLGSKSAGTTRHPNRATCLSITPRGTGFARTSAGLSWPPTLTRKNSCLSKAAWLHSSAVSMCRALPNPAGTVAEAYRGLSVRVRPNTKVLAKAHPQGLWALRLAKRPSGGVQLRFCGWKRNRFSGWTTHV